MKALRQTAGRPVGVRCQPDDLVAGTLKVFKLFFAGL